MWRHGESRATGPNSTRADAPPLIRNQIAVYRRAAIEPIVLPRMWGSWLGYVFTAEPLRLPVRNFGLGHGNGAHAPDEYYLIDSTNPKLHGIDGAVRSFVEFLYAMAASSLGTAVDTPRQFACRIQSERRSPTIAWGRNLSVVTTASS